MNELNLKQEIGELIISIGEGKFTEKAKELLTRQYEKGYKVKDDELKKVVHKGRDEQLTQIKDFFKQKSDFYENETITLLLKEIEWKLENEIIKK